MKPFFRALGQFFLACLRFLGGLLRDLSRQSWRFVWRRRARWAPYVIGGLFLVYLSKNPGFLEVVFSYIIIIGLMYFVLNAVRRRIGKKKKRR